MKPSKVANHHYSNSVKVTTPLVSFLTHQSSISVLEAHDEMIADMQDIHQSNCSVVKYKFDNIYKHLNLSLKKCVDMACEKGTSSWLSVLLI